MKGDKALAKECFLKRLRSELERGVCARHVDTDDDEKAVMSELLPQSPSYTRNMSERILRAASAVGYAAEGDYRGGGAEVLLFTPSLRRDGLSRAGGKELFLSELGIENGGLDLLIRRSYSLLGLISYLTAGEPEVRAWTIKKGTKAPQAAGKIHSDFERGFIRAEVISFDELVACGSMAAAKEKGLVRSEGKDYIMRDGDVVLFRFNV